MSRFDRIGRTFFSIFILAASVWIFSTVKTTAQPPQEATYVDRVQNQGTEQDLAPSEYWWLAFGFFVLFGVLFAARRFRQSPPEEE